MRFTTESARSLLAGVFPLAAVLCSQPGRGGGDYVSPGMRHLTTAGAPAYEELLREREGVVLHVRHWVNMGGLVMNEIIETFDSSGGFTGRHVVVNIQGRGASPIGRVVETDTGEVAQFFIKNHLGSTVRVVNADGSYATTPVFDYQPYGELQAIREDSLNPVREKFTGKGLDTEVNLYYFGARWYDAELGMWISPDAAGQYFNPYSYGGGAPIIGIDEDGNWFIIDDLIAAGVGAVVGAGIAIAKGYDPFDAQFWAYTGGGAAIAWASYATAGAAAGALGGAGTFAGAVAGGATAGAVAGLGNYSLQSGVDNGFSDWSVSGAWDATWKGAAVGAVTGGLDQYIGLSSSQSLWSQAGFGFAKGALVGTAGVATSDILDDGRFNAGPKAYLTAGLIGGGLGSLQSVHHARNLRNQEPTSLDELNGQDWQQVRDDEAVFHRQGAGNELNKKFVHVDGHEVVVSSGGQIIRDPVNMGSFNYVKNSTSTIGHTFTDVAPYFLYGNTASHNLRYGFQAYWTVWQRSY